MNKWLIGNIFLWSLLTTSCTTVEYKGAKKFTFLDKELHTKIVYFCQDKKTLYPMEIRASKAHQYFTTQNNHNADLLMRDIEKNRNQKEAMHAFNNRAKKLALSLHRKFACTLVDTIDD